MKPLIRLSGLLVSGALLLSACSPTALIRSLESIGDQFVQSNAPEVAVQQSTPVVQEDTPPLVSAQSTEMMSAFQGTLEEIYGKVSPSVVNIQVAALLPTQNQMSPFGFQSDPTVPAQPVQTGLGSGFVWDKSGHIVTNNHVIEGADKVTVTFTDGFTVAGEVIGQDPYSDLAVVKVDVSADRLQPVQMADSNQVNVGQIAIAIGNPFGLEGTMTFGIVSAIGRSLPVTEGAVTTANYQIPDVIQTDAPINPGNSGGVLVNDLGQLIGVTAAIESSTNSSAGIGFAIPANIVQKVVPTLIDNGQVQYSWLGVQGNTLTSEVAQAMDLSAEQRGALVAEVTADGPAAKAGLRGSSEVVTIDGNQFALGGDVITAIDGKAVKVFDDVVSYLIESTQVGQTVTLTILRDGNEQTIDVILEARPGSAVSQTVELDGNDLSSQAAWIGIQGTTLTADLAQSNGLDQDQQGVLIQQVIQDGPADNANLRQGDIIVGLNSSEILSMSDLRQAIAQLRPGATVTLTVLRDGRQGEVDVTLTAR